MPEPVSSARPLAQRKAMLRQQVTDFLDKGKMENHADALQGSCAAGREDDYPRQEERPGRLSSGHELHYQRDVVKKLFKKLLPAAMLNVTAATPHHPHRRAPRRCQRNRSD